MKVNLFIFVSVVASSVILQASENEVRHPRTAKVTVRRNAEKHHLRNSANTDLTSKEHKKHIAKEGEVVNASYKSVAIRFNDLEKTYVLPGKHKFNVKNFRNIKKLTVDGKAFTTCKAPKHSKHYNSLIYSVRDDKPSLSCASLI
jgi:hypothetical protein